MRPGTPPPNGQGVPTHGRGFSEMLKICSWGNPSVTFGLIAPSHHDARPCVVIEGASTQI
jgi:hypothetical protein